MRQPRRRGVSTSKGTRSTTKIGSQKQNTPPSTEPKLIRLKPFAFEGVNLRVSSGAHSAKPPELAKFRSHGKSALQLVTRERSEQYFEIRVDTVFAIGACQILTMCDLSHLQFHACFRLLYTMKVVLLEFHCEKLAWGIRCIRQFPFPLQVFSS